MPLEPRDGETGADTELSRPWMVVSLAFAVLAAVALWAVAFALRDSFAAADRMAAGLRGRGSPGTLVLLGAAVAGWCSAYLAERTWGCVGWPLLYSTFTSAAVTGAVATVLLLATGLQSSPSLAATFVLSPIVSAGVGAFGAYWRSVRR